MRHTYTHTQGQTVRVGASCQAEDQAAQGKRLNDQIRRINQGKTNPPNSEPKGASPKQTPTRPKGKTKVSVSYNLRYNSIKLQVQKTKKERKGVQVYLRREPKTNKVWILRSNIFHCRSTRKPPHPFHDTWNCPTFEM